jgi:CubicO group peptidase (beta-lactamase class C family)
MSKAKLAAIPARYQQFLDDDKLAGLITVVARDGKVVHFEAFGSMDTERGKPMAPDTIFRMYSMTKPVTGAAVMILVDEGKLALTDPVSSHIPEFANARVLVEGENGEHSTVPAQAPMTLWHLMTHTGGLTYGGRDSTLSKMYTDNGVDSDGGSGLTLEEFAEKVAAMPLLFEPGTRWNYGVSMDVLGRVVEVVSGQRYGDFLEARIFAPLGMKDSAFHVPDEKLERLAANYGPAENGKRLIDDPETSRYRKIPSLDSGGGGMVGTAPDYLRFAQMLLNGGELDGVRILSTESVEEMITNQLPKGLGEAPVNLLPGVDFGGLGFGYCGAAVMEGRETTLFGPAGVYSWGGAASTDFWIDRHERLVGMVLTQLIPTATYPTRALLQSAVYEAVVVSYRSSDSD